MEKVVIKRGIRYVCIIFKVSQILVVNLPLILGMRGILTLSRAMAKARAITTEIGGKLHVESLQDEHRSKQSQFGFGSKVEGGFGSAWEVSGNVNAEGGNSHSKQVKEQAGLFAEERYSVEADTITLVGGAIAANTEGTAQYAPTTSHLVILKTAVATVQQAAPSAAATHKVAE